MLRQAIEPSEGDVIVPSDICIGYVEQIIHEGDALSGGQRFNKKLSEVLAQSPDLLLLDEPTNHLDKDNCKSLLRMLNGYHGTMVIVSHDTELLRSCIDTLWHIDNHKIHTFTGLYDDYIAKIKKTAYQYRNHWHHLIVKKNIRIKH